MNNNLSLKIKEEDKIPTITPKEQAEIDEKIVQMVLIDINPINVVEKKGFQSLISYIKPGYVIPSRGTLESLLDKHCRENEKKIKILTQTKALYPSYTVDLWKSNAKEYFISIALHFIDNNWILHSPLLCCEHVVGSHTKDNIGKLVAEKLIPFLGENAKVHSGVTDGGELASVGYTSIELRKTNNSFMRKVESRLCVCHKLNNSIKRLLKDFFGTTYIEKWRAFITHLNFSDPFNQLFEKCKKQIFSSTGENLKSRPQKAPKPDGHRQH